jgi:hypothetical protein
MRVGLLSREGRAGPMALVRSSELTVIDEKNNKCPIYSISVHPDGTRLATGGLGTSSRRVMPRIEDPAKLPDHKVKIWSTLPVLDETADTESDPKLLCTMTTHSGMSPRSTGGRESDKIRFSARSSLGSSWAIFGEWIRRSSCGHLGARSVSRPSDLLNVQFAGQNPGLS